jgi:hypothetical protein
MMLSSRSDEFGLVMRVAMRQVRTTRHLRKSFSQRDLPSARYAHMMRQGTTLKTMDARLSATNQCHRNTTPATVRTVSSTTHPTDSTLCCEPCP